MGEERDEERTEESRFDLIRQTVEETHTVAMLKGMLACCPFLEDYEKIRRLTRKGDLVPLAADVYCSPAKLAAFIGALGSPAEELVRHLLWVEDESLDRLIKLFDLAPPPGSWEREKFLPRPFLFKIVYPEQVRLQPGFEYLFRPLLPRPAIREETWSDAPGGFLYTPDGSLAGSLREIFHLLLDSGFFKRKYNAPVLTGTVKKLTKGLSLPGFDWDDRFPGLRWRFILPFLAFTLWDGEDEDPSEPPLDADPVDLIRRMVRSYFHSERYDLDLSLLLPHLSVKRKELFFQDYGEQRTEYLPRLFRFFGSWRWEEWLSTESLEDLFWADNLRIPLPRE